MVYTIKNDFLTASVSSLGAELTSIKTNDGCEYLWQADPAYWAGQAPIMFPTCGRLFEGKYTYLGKEYSLPNHGIARSSEFSLNCLSSSSLSLELKSSEVTKEKYPFDFTFIVTFSLSGNALKVEYLVRNDDTRELIFALGGHPAFNVPIESGARFEDYYVEFPHTSDALRVDFSPACFCTHNDKLFTQGGTRRINLTHDLFDNDAIFLYNVPKEISLKSDKTKRAVTLYFKDMKYVGLWHMPKTDAPYICIEPWSSIPATDGFIDDLLTKKEMIHLPSGYTHKKSYTIKID